MQTPYNEKRFIEIFTNQDRKLEAISPEEVVKANEPLFQYLDNLPGTFSFIYDFSNAKYLLVSKSIRSVCGRNEDVLLKGGFAECLKYFHPDDRNNVGFIHQEMFGFIYNVPASDITRYRFDFNYRVLNSQNEYITILQQSMFTAVVDGKPLYDISTCTDITLSKRNSRMELCIFRQNDDKTFTLVHEYTVPSTIGCNLSNTEFKILRLASQGLSSKEIAEQCSRSLHTINNHRKNILFKTDSSTLAEAIQKVKL